MTEKVHELKSWPEFFKPIVSGEKTFELRKNDRNFKVGDIITSFAGKSKYDAYYKQTPGKRR